ncbi:carbohydrate ABC transporter permease [Candidatus Omnitrophota bacterium]
MQKTPIKDILGNYIFVLPAVALFFIFHLYPFLNVFVLSLHKWNGISPTKEFIGFAHFIDIFTANPQWWQSMWHALYITLLTLIFQNGLALMLALACDKAIRGANTYRVIFFIPPLLSGIVVGLIWQWIYDGNYGLLNHWLSTIGFGHLARAWLGDAKTALTCVGIAHMWKGFGWGFIILLAGLQSIPRQLYEAARVDGAGSWDTFTKVTAPLMVPVFVLVTILTILHTMQIFELVVSTTKGGPGWHTEVPITRILYYMCSSSQFGYACALGVVFGIILLIVSFAQIQAAKLVKQE